jgi:hypothetical protein
LRASRFEWAAARGSAPKPGLDTWAGLLQHGPGQATDETSSRWPETRASSSSVYARARPGNIDALLNSVAYLTMDYDWTDRGQEEHREVVIQT